MIKTALLMLEDGTIFYGKSIGIEGIVTGEVVFNTSMTGYQEIITDPSYSHQIIVLTYPHIGNTGINKEDNESYSIHANALVIKELSNISSNIRYTESLSNFLRKNKIVGISNIDTRKLTRILRKYGSQNACIIAGNNLDINLAKNKVKNCLHMKDMDLAKLVSTKKKYIWTKGSISINNKINNVKKNNLKYHVVAYDYGIKHSIMRILVDHGCKLTVVPAQTSAKIVLSMNPDGIFLSNGPGDPASCHYAINSIKKFLLTKIPIFGICLGHQLLALSIGAKTIKMKFGHHGSNHPVKNIQTNKVIITTQNHNFTVDSNTLPSSVIITHVSLFDGTLQGLHFVDKPVFSFQGHPEANPGPHDANLFFNHFIDLIRFYRLSKI
ncbi:MAG: glutamine-hydrolyzing carbamoyl-phosphate synthase small subunit [Enterobacterales bacterium]